MVPAVLLLQACATPHTPVSYPAPVSADALIPADPALDHYIAWLPMRHAQTATVAEALTHVTLREVRDQAVHDVCGNAYAGGSPVIERYGPLAAIMPDGEVAWYYRISRQPGHGGCGTRQSDALHRSISGHLPVWLSLEPATRRQLSLEQSSTTGHR